MDAHTHTPLSPAPLSADEEDLRWYFRFRPSPAGLVSSYPAMIRQLLLEGATSTNYPQAPFDDCALDDRDRAARIERILASTPEDSMRTLERAFSGPFPRHAETFGRHAALAVESPFTLRTYRAARTRRGVDAWLSDLIFESSWDESSLQTLDRIRANAADELRHALAGYREGKRKTGTTGRAEPTRIPRQGGRHGQS